MTKKQHKEIAIMWSATLLDQCGTDSFDNIDIDDACAICEEVQRLSEKMLRNRPYILTLPRIIQYVLTGKPE
jgi:hypothetical protein